MVCANWENGNQRNLFHSVFDRSRAFSYAHQVRVGVRLAFQLFITFRSKAISFGMAICTIGGFISPLIIETQVVVTWLPFGLYGLAAFLGFLSSFCIPGSDFNLLPPPGVGIIR